MSATEYRLTYRKNRKANKNASTYNDGNTINNWRQKKMKIDCKVEITDIKEMTVAYLRHVETYAELGEVFQETLGKIISWGVSRRLMHNPKTRLLAIYHDNPEITEDEKKERAYVSPCLKI